VLKPLRRRAPGNAPDYPGVLQVVRDRDTLLAIRIRAEALDHLLTTVTFVCLIVCKATSPLTPPSR